MAVILKTNFKDILQYTITTKQFDGDYTDFTDNKHMLAVKQVHQSSTSCLGMVVYCVPIFYGASKEANEDIHIPGIKDTIGRELISTVFNSLFKDVYGKEPSQITFGHEHGDENGKCHIQICINFSDTFRGTIKPGVITFNINNGFEEYEEWNGVRLLYMVQKARNPRALVQYCMKDGDFFYLYPDKAVKTVFKKNTKGEATEKVDPFATVVQNRDKLSQEQAIELVLNHEPRTGITMFKNIEYCVKNIIAESLPSFKWNYPDHLVNKFPTIEKWYYDWCIPENLKRRKALLLYSEKRALGKTEFALSLVNDPAYVVIFRNTFVDCMKNKQPKLLILDDMSPYKTENKETWKALVASQPTAIRDAYLNYNWEFSIPCIITTNNLFLVKQLYFSSEFNTQIVFQQVDSYMGPPGTEPDSMFNVEADFSYELFNKLDNMRQENDEKFLNKKRSTDFDVLSKLLKAEQRIKDLENELNKIKKSK